MTRRKPDLPFPVLPASLQVAFSKRLQTLRRIFFHEALADTIDKVTIADLNAELERYVEDEYLKRLAVLGLRGEIVFPVPLILRTNPRLLGYYRLLYGISQKEMYNKGPYQRFRCLEERGEIPSKYQEQIEPFCRSLIETGKQLVDGIEELSLDGVRDLQLLTLGAQLRGSRNTTVGREATEEVFEIIRQIVEPYIQVLRPNKAILIVNDSGRAIRIEFSPDPDIRIVEEARSGLLPLVSIEIKGGEDGSNIHNRLGEAEKSHQKAKARGFSRFWTVIRVEMDYDTASRESPTTTRFFHIDRIQDEGSEEYLLFRDMIMSTLGISC